MQESLIHSYSWKCWELVLSASPSQTKPFESHSAYIWLLSNFKGWMAFITSNTAHSIASWLVLVGIGNGTNIGTNVGCGNGANIPTSVGTNTSNSVWYYQQYCLVSTMVLALMLALISSLALELLSSLLLQYSLYLSALSLFWDLDISTVAGIQMQLFSLGWSILPSNSTAFAYRFFLTQPHPKCLPFIQFKFMGLSHLFGCMAVLNRCHQPLWVYANQLFLLHNW